MPASKKGCKKIRGKAIKKKNKRVIPEGDALITEGDAKFSSKDFDGAFDCFTRAKAAFEASAVAQVQTKKPKKRKPKKAATGAAATGADDESERILKPPGTMCAKADPKDPLDGSFVYNTPTGQPYSINSKERMAEHIAKAKKEWRTRFPPEPNGYLHIGHAKAINFDFSVALRNGGRCLLRYDDTNPSAEKQEYIDSIEATLKWLKFKPWTITYSSDYFQELYDYAVQLIKKDKAYVCHQTQTQVKESRERLQAFHQGLKGVKYAEKAKLPLHKGIQSPYRNRPIEESLRLFEQMRQGRWKEGTATLRMKMDLYSDRPSMWDTHAYRIMFEPHPHSGNMWCVYPTYDYTHCIVDSIENISHSLCTLEFGGRQAPDGSYYWLLDALDLYKPMTWESSRLNITGNVMSKRKLNRLVTEKIVNGWDDPRLFTLDGLKRRGYTASAVNGFCKMVGVTRNQSTTPCYLLERCIRADLDNRAPRVFGVIRPLRVRLTNYTDDPKVLQVPFHPKNPSFGKRPMMFGPKLYIDRQDFRMVDSEDYHGLAPGKSAKLLFAYVITCDEVVKNAAGKVVELRCTYHEEAPAKKPKSFLHWVCDNDCVDAEIRIYNSLFTVDEPIKAAVAAIKAEAAGTADDDAGDEEDAEVDIGDRWLTYLNNQSLIVHTGKVEAFLGSQRYEKGEFQSFQFQRRGYFCVDKDSRGSHLVFNRTVTLRETVATKTAKSSS